MLSTASVASYAKVSCSDITYGSESYGDKMEELAVLARLPENYYNRYHEDAVGYICKNDTKSLKALIDDGYVKKSEVESIKEVLGADNRSKSGKVFSDSRKKLINIGLSEVDADNAARYYSKAPKSKCGKLAKSALEGNQHAIKELLTSPHYCTWKY